MSIKITPEANGFTVYHRALTEDEVKLLSVEIYNDKVKKHRYLADLHSKYADYIEQVDKPISFKKFELVYFSMMEHIGWVEK
jgi:hypothetical protein